MNNHYSFIGGSKGSWQVISCDAVIGAPLETVQRVNVVNMPSINLAERGTWVLQGFTSNVRYAERHEISRLREKQEDLNRPTSSCAALIPIKKTAEWWAMSQDERRKILKHSHTTQKLVWHIFPKSHDNYIIHVISASRSIS